ATGSRCIPQGSPTAACPCSGTQPDWHAAAPPPGPHTRDAHGCGTAGAPGPASTLSGPVVKAGLILVAQVGRHVLRRLVRRLADLERALGRHAALDPTSNLALRHADVPAAVLGDPIGKHCVECAALDGPRHVVGTAAAECGGLADVQVGTHLQQAHL